MYDMKNLGKFKRFGELAPEPFKAFVAFDEAAYKSGAIPHKYKELIAVARPWTSITNFIYVRSDQLRGSTGALHMRTSLQQRAWLMTSLKNELERKNVLLRSSALIDELAWLRRGESGDYDEISAGGDAIPVGRAHAVALGIEAWLKSAMPSVYKLVPAQQPLPTDPQTIGQQLVANFLKTHVLSPPKKVRPRLYTGPLRLR